MEVSWVWVVFSFCHHCLLFLAAILSEFHESLLSTLCSLLVDPNPLSVRKRAYIALCEFPSTASMSINYIIYIPLAHKFIKKKFH